MVKATDGTISASYEYGPFGEVIRATGPMARANPFRFSTKFQDDETDLLYYGHRYYSASLGRWISRDAIEEEGGLALYSFVANDPENLVDILGNAPMGWGVLPPPGYPPSMPPGGYGNPNDSFTQGFVSYFRGAYRMARFTFRYCGCCGQAGKQAAQLELKVAFLVAKEGLSNDELRQIAWEKAKDRIKEDPCKVIGRATAGATTSLLLTSRFGKSGRIAGMTVSLRAATGDALYQCEIGLRLLRENFPGVYDNLDEGIKIFEALTPEQRQQLIESITDGIVTGGN